MKPMKIPHCSRNTAAHLALPEYRVLSGIGQRVPVCRVMALSASAVARAVTVMRARAMAVIVCTILTSLWVRAVTAGAATRTVTRHHTVDVESEPAVVQTITTSSSSAAALSR